MSDLSSRTPSALGVPEHLGPDTPTPFNPPHTEELSSTLDGIQKTMRLMYGQQQANTKRFELLAEDVERIEQPRPAASDERLSAVEEAVKNVKPWKTLLGFVGALAVGVITIVVTLRDYAKESVIETVQRAHKEDIEPSVKTVDALKKDLGAVQSGVTELVEQKDKEKQIKTVEIELELHQEQYQEALQDWSARKAARRNVGLKPKKTSAHLALEARLKQLAG